MPIRDSIKKAAIALLKADSVVITAGAGIGVDSGLPDFRGDEGFWRAYPPIAKLGISFVEMANPRWFEFKPDLAWAFYGHRLNLYRKTNPHKGFFQLKKIAEQKPGGYFIFTSNVDGQFHKAGYQSDFIEECHGSIHHLQCVDACNTEIWSASDVEVNVDEDKFIAMDSLPGCVNCGRLARPNILMFGDWSWIPHRSDSQAYRFETWLRKIEQKKMGLAIIELGAGTSVPTVRMKSENLAQFYNGTLIRINPREYDAPAGQISIPLGSADGINQIYEEIKLL